MVGFNFTRGEVLSTKFYYVFRNPEFISKNLQWGALDDLLRHLVARRSRPHFGEYLSAGGWLTLTIKFDQWWNPSYGFFLRVENDNSELIRNVIEEHPELSLRQSDFESGYGQYVMEEMSGAERSEYVYLKRPSLLSQLGELHDINFSSVDRVEISSASAPATQHKFIAVDINNAAGARFMDRIPKDARALLAGTPHALCCPAVQPKTGQYSIYAIPPRRNDRFVSSIIDDIAKN